MNPGNVHIKDGTNGGAATVEKSARILPVCFLSCETTTATMQSSEQNKTHMINSDVSLAYSHLIDALEAANALGKGERRICGVRCCRSRLCDDDDARRDKQLQSKNERKQQQQCYTFDFSRKWNLFKLNLIILNNHCCCCCCCCCYHLNNTDLLCFLFLLWCFVALSLSSIRKHFPVVRPCIRSFCSLVLNV